MMTKAQRMAAGKKAAETKARKRAAAALVALRTLEKAVRYWTRLR